MSHDLADEPVLVIRRIEEEFGRVVQARACLGDAAEHAPDVDAVRGEVADDADGVGASGPDVARPRVEDVVEFLRRRQDTGARLRGDAHAGMAAVEHQGDGRGAYATECRDVLQSGHV